MSKSLKKINSKIFIEKDLKKKLDFWRQNGDKIVFTNGCFDLIHLGHIEVLARSADLGDRLIIGVNTDKSIKNIKGKNRPIIKEDSRVKQLAALAFVDAVILFNEPTPNKIIHHINPDIITKGGDYKTKEVVGYETVIENNGRVVIIPLTKGYSTTSILNKIKNE